jgi:hypothetical protein
MRWLLIVWSIGFVMVLACRKDTGAKAEEPKAEEPKAEEPKATVGADGFFYGSVEITIVTAPAAAGETKRDDVEARDEAGDFDPPTQLAAVTADECVAHAGEPTGMKCLETLAVLDRKAAVAAARAPGFTRRTWVDGGDLVRTLSLYPDAAAFDKQLKSWGLLPGPNSGRARPPSHALVTATEQLIWAGRVEAFDAETGMFPNQHDLLLVDLAALAPELGEVRFEEVAPRSDDGPYFLHGYVGGKRYRIQARNLDDWYDVTAAVGLLNSIARDRGIAIRFAVLPSEGQVAWVIAGPADGLRAARDAGLLPFGDPDEAMGIGKAYERKVIEEIERGEIDPR